MNNSLQHKLKNIFKNVQIASLRVFVNTANVSKNNTYNKWDFELKKITALKLKYLTWLKALVKKLGVYDLVWSLIYSQVWTSGQSH